MFPSLGWKDDALGKIVKNLTKKELESGSHTALVSAPLLLRGPHPSWCLTQACPAQEPTPQARAGLPCLRSVICAATSCCPFQGALSGRASLSFPHAWPGTEWTSCGYPEPWAARGHGWVIAPLCLEGGLAVSSPEHGWTSLLSEITAVLTQT